MVAKCAKRGSWWGNEWFRQAKECSKLGKLWGRWNRCSIRVWRSRSRLGNFLLKQGGKWNVTQTITNGIIVKWGNWNYWAKILK